MSGILIMVPTFFLPFLKDAILADLPADAAAQVSGRLHVSLTDMRFNNQLVSEFTNQEELVDALTCSCFIPAFSGYRGPRYRGRRYLDGGLTNTLPILDAATVRVSPFSGAHKEICPPDIQRTAGSDLAGGDGEKTVASVSLAGENFYLLRSNLVRGVHAAGAVSEAQLASYYLAGYRDACRYFTQLRMRGPCVTV